MIAGDERVRGRSHRFDATEPRLPRRVDLRVWVTVVQIETQPAARPTNGDQSDGGEPEQVVEVPVSWTPAATRG